ncbi:hypothetical protein BBJ41_24805 [Burkholderia stabilis]|nr:hypothetical protein BBJ41_24805 [Burkholderia stabilis]
MCFAGASNRAAVDTRAAQSADTPSSRIALRGRFELGCDASAQMVCLSRRAQPDRLLRLHRAPCIAGASNRAAT